MARSASLTRPVGTAGHVGTTECVTITEDMDADFDAQEVDPRAPPGRLSCCVFN